MQDLTLWAFLSQGGRLVVLRRDDDAAVFHGDAHPLIGLQVRRARHRRRRAHAQVLASGLPTAIAAPSIVVQPSARHDLRHDLRDGLRMPALRCGGLAVVCRDVVAPRPLVAPACQSPPCLGRDRANYAAIRQIPLAFLALPVSFLSLGSSSDPRLPPSSREKNSNK